MSDCRTAIPEVAFRHRQRTRMALTERQLRQVERLLDEIEAAVDDHDWALVRQRVDTVLLIDPENADALAALAVVERAEATESAPLAASVAPLAPPAVPPSPAPEPS